MKNHALFDNVIRRLGFSTSHTLEHCAEIFKKLMNEELSQKVTYAILGFSSGFIFGFLWEISTLKTGHLAYQNGYHYHHSLFGLVAFLFITKFWGDLNKILFIAGFGFGVIVQHAIIEGLIFITKY